MEGVHQNTTKRSASSNSHTVAVNSRRGKHKQMSYEIVQHVGTPSPSDSGTSNKVNVVGKEKEEEREKSTSSMTPPSASLNSAKVKAKTIPEEKVLRDKANAEEMYQEQHAKKSERIQNSKTPTADESSTDDESNSGTESKSINKNQLKQGDNNKSKKKQKIQRPDSPIVTNHDELDLSFEPDVQMSVVFHPDNCVETCASEKRKNNESTKSVEVDIAETSKSLHDKSITPELKNGFKKVSLQTNKLQKIQENKDVKIINHPLESSSPDISSDDSHEIGVPLHKQTRRLEEKRGSTDDGEIPSSSSSHETKRNVCKAAVDCSGRSSSTESYETDEYDTCNIRMKILPICNKVQAAEKKNKKKPSHSGHDEKQTLVNHNTSQKSRKRKNQKKKQKQLSLTHNGNKETEKETQGTETPSSPNTMDHPTGKVSNQVNVSTSGKSNQCENGKSDLPDSSPEQNASSGTQRFSPHCPQTRMQTRQHTATNQTSESLQQCQTEVINNSDSKQSPTHQVDGSKVTQRKRKKKRGSQPQSAGKLKIPPNLDIPPSVKKLLAKKETPAEKQQNINYIISFYEELNNNCSKASELETRINDFWGPMSETSNLNTQIKNQIKWFEECNTFNYKPIEMKIGCAMKGLESARELLEMRGPVIEAQEMDTADDTTAQEAVLPDMGKLLAESEDMKRITSITMKVLAINYQVCECLVEHVWAHMHLLQYQHAVAGIFPTGKVEKEAKEQCIALCEQIFKTMGEQVTTESNCNTYLESTSQIESAAMTALDLYTQARTGTATSSLSQGQIRWLETKVLQCQTQLDKISVAGGRTREARRTVLYLCNQTLSLLNEGRE